jgi:hypothetical protein
MIECLDMVSIYGMRSSFKVSDSHQNEATSVWSFCRPTSVVFLLLFLR